MKKRLISLILILGILIPTCFTFTGISASAAVSINPDDVFKETIGGISEASGLRYEKSALYNIDFEDVGLYYFFSTGIENGYAFVFRSEIGYSVDEIYYTQTNPIAEGNLPVYVAPGIFFEYDGNNLLNALTDEIVLADIGYSMTVSLVNTIEEFYFERKTSETYKINIGVPFYSSSSYLNSCANISGSIVIGYYDRLFPNLIPNFEAWDYSRNQFATDTPQVRAVADQLYFDMNTNTNNGTTLTEFLGGIHKYIMKDNSRLPYYDDLMIKSGSINYTKFKAAIQSGLPVVGFFRGFNIIFDYARESNREAYMVGVNTGNHTMVVYGYESFKYYRTETNRVWSPVWYNPFRYIDVTEEVNFRTDEYMLVSTGVSPIEKALMRLNHNNSIVEHLVSISLK